MGLQKFVPLFLNGVVSLIHQCCPHAGIVDIVNCHLINFANASWYFLQYFEVLINVILKNLHVVNETRIQ